MKDQIKPVTMENHLGSMIKWGVDEPLSGFRPKMMRIIPLPCRIILYHAESSLYHGESFGVNEKGGCRGTIFFMWADLSYFDRFD
jgi:hypothetical protein